MSAHTVLGLVPAGELGRTLMHEHLLFDMSACLSTPRNAVERSMAERPLERETLGALRLNPCVVPDNLLENDVGIAVEEVAESTAIGGETLVEESGLPHFYRTHDDLERTLRWRDRQNGYDFETNEWTVW